LPKYIEAIENANAAKYAAAHRADDFALIADRHPPTPGDKSRIAIGKALFFDASPTAFEGLRSRADVNALFRAMVIEVCVRAQEGDQLPISISNGHRRAELVSVELLDNRVDDLSRIMV
jgi:hypothetical protein